METQQITQSQAVDLLVQAAELGQRRGAFKLAEAALLDRAIKVLYPDRATTQIQSEANEEDATGEDNE